MKVGQFLTASLLILFIGLKLTEHISWSWLWVLAPAWGPFALITFLLILRAIALRLESPEQKVARELRRFGEALNRKRR